MLIFHTNALEYHEFAKAILQYLAGFSSLVPIASGRSLSEGMVSLLRIKVKARKETELVKHVKT